MLAAIRWITLLADLTVSDVADGRDRQKTLALMEIAEALKLIRNPPRLTALPTSSRLRCDAGALYPRGELFTENAAGALL
jgi:hypothetical protein